MAIAGIPDPSISTAHLRELAEATGRDRQAANVLRGARALNLRFATTPAPCGLCWIRHTHDPDKFPRPVGGARYSIDSSILITGAHGLPEHPRILVCTTHAALRTSRAGARRACGWPTHFGADR